MLRVSGLVLLLLLVPAASAAPAIALLSIPPSGSSQDWISGVVEGAEPIDHVVVVYIEVEGRWWGPKPTWADPLTPIRADGFWNATFATGGTDLAATGFAAYLLPANGVGPAIPPALAGTTTLPDSLAVYPRVVESRPVVAPRAVPMVVRNRTDLVGLCVGLFVGGEQPGTTVLSETVLRQRLAIVAPTTTWVRTYGVDHGLERAGAVAHGLGMRAAVGAWISQDPAANRRALETLAAIGNAGEADILIVGSETLLTGTLSERDLVTYIQWVRREVPGVPVCSADAYGEFLTHPALVDASDLLLIHAYPFWEGSAIDTAANRTVDAWNRVAVVAGDRPVIVGETGWPDGGNPNGAAVPSSENAGRYLREATDLFHARGIPYFYFSAFDEAWKSAEPGGVGPHWGIWDGALQLKPGRLPLEVAPSTVPGGMNTPGDLDGDGLYEDVNGNGRRDFADVVLYFNQMSWIATNEPVSMFDFTGNGRIDFADIVRLFNDL